MPLESELYQTQPTDVSNRFIDFSPRPGVASNVIDQHRRNLRASRWSLAVDIPNTRGLSTCPEEGLAPTIREDKMATNWVSLASSLKTEASESIDYIDRNRVMKLSQIAQACVALEQKLRNYVRRNSQSRLPQEHIIALETYLGKRNSQDVLDDTYFTHGARCASYVYDMGVTDPYAFALAGLHDLYELLKFHPKIGLKVGETSVRNVVINNLKTAFSAVKDIINVDDLVEDITRFAEAAEARRKVAENAFEKLQGNFPVGREFTWKQFVDFEAEIASKYTNTPTLEGGSGELYYGWHRGNSEKGKKRSKFPNLVQVLSESNSNISANTAQRKGKIRPSSPSLHIAELAAALDHSYFPKKPIRGEAPEDRLRREQIYATGLMATLLPIYQAYGDPARRLALEVIYRAFLPGSMSNMYEAVGQLAIENGGSFVDGYDKNYSREVVSLVMNYLRDNPDARLVSDTEFESRRLELALGGDNRKLLEANEINVTGLECGEDGLLEMQMNRKTAASVMQKILSRFADDKKRSKLDPAIQELEFGSVAFWKYVIPRLHDFIRAQFTLGSGQRDVFIDYLMQYFTNQNNEAESPYHFPDEKARMNELIEHSEGSLNIIFARDLPNADSSRSGDSSRSRHSRGPRINCELHAIGVEKEINRENMPNSTHRAPYKLRRMVTDQLRPIDPTQEIIQKMKEDLAREAIEAWKNYMRMLYAYEAPGNSRQTVKGIVFSRNIKRTNKSK